MARVARALAALLSFFTAGCGAVGPGSIGAVLGRDNETRALHVREVASESSLAVGDEIVMIEGVYVRDLGADEIRSKLRGETGTKVALTIVRGRDVKHVEVTRAKMGEKKAKAPREERIAE